MKIPAVAISRLSVYARHLSVLDTNGREVISSGHLADLCGVNPAQIRKDLAYFGEFGVRGVGYYVKELLFEIRKILGADKQWRLALVGAGNLGSALLRHMSRADRGYRFIVAFDRNPKRIGERIGEVEVKPLDAIDRLIEALDIEIGAIAVGPESAQEVCDRLIRAGIRGILNFAPVQIQCPPHVSVEHVDFTLKLDRLCYRLTSES
ncbi:MAG: redox-sensing transcriptional repressor Rex [Deltaproteobacteria bacterium]|nr:redox-sensing transcriptional repressor Rex [Deltaproteobacteria bacterium]